MALTLYFHPLASFCHKVLIGLYENETPFTPFVIGADNPGSVEALLALWPVGKFPVLRDDDRDRTLPETTIILEYLEQHYPGSHPLFPTDAQERLDARLWDRFFDLYVQVPMQKVVADRLRPDGEKDPRGVEEARATLAKACSMLEQRMAGRTWALGNAFSIADCAAAPALFYASIVQPFAPDQAQLAAYFDRLMDRPSVRRVLDEARPWFPYFPFHADIPARFVS